MCLRVLNESNKSRFDQYSRQKHCIDHIPYYLSGLSRAHLSDNLSRNSCIHLYVLSLPIDFSHPQLPSNKEATKQNRHRRCARLFLMNVLDVKKCLAINFKVGHSLRENGSDLDHKLQNKSENRGKKTYILRPT